MEKTTKLHKKIRKQMEKAIREYRMIEEGDRVLIGVSGGPDSLSLLKLMSEPLHFISKDVSFLAAHIDIGLDEKKSGQWRILEDHFKSLDVDFKFIHTQIGAMALDPQAKKNPCFICSMYRRKAIYQLANEEKCTKIAYGHHKDDIIETLLINILYGRKIEAMRPVQEVFKGAMHIIRPLAYTDEWQLKQYAREQNLPELVRLCPMDGNTRRQKVKELIKQLQREEKNANIRENIFKSLSHVNMGFDP